MNTSTIKKVLITGAAGFTGTHLTSLLSKEEGSELCCAGLGEHLPKGFVRCDFSDASLVRTLIADFKPTKIYHLVGSYTNRFETDFVTNVTSTRNILETIRELSLSCRVLLVGSAAEYGFPTNPDVGVREDEPLAPVSIYGMVKVFQTKLMETFVRMYGLDIVEVRPFNLSGTHMPRVLFIGSMEAQIQKYKSGELKEVVTGDLSVERDYIDIEAAAEYYRTVMERGTAGEVYNVGSGTGVSLRSVLESMVEKAGLTMDIVRESTHETPGKIVVPKIFADISKLHSL